MNGGGRAPDIFAKLRSGCGLLQLLFLLRFVNWTFEQPFSSSFRRCSFGMSALTGSALRFMDQQPDSVVAAMAGLFSFSATWCSPAAGGHAAAHAPGRIPAAEARPARLNSILFRVIQSHPRFRFSAALSYADKQAI